MSTDKKDQTIQQQLDSNIPESAVTKREAYKNGPQLSYLTGAYVTDRMNQVLGQGNWGYQLEELTKVYEGEIEQYNGKAFTTSYIAKVTLAANVGGKSVYFTEIGYGDGTDKKSAGKAHELAVKEATTDGFKRAAKNLGRSMGLGLYFKDGQYIEETEVKTAPTPPVAAKTNPKPKATSAAPSAVAPEVVRKTVKAAFDVLVAKQAITQEAFVAEYLGGNKLATLTADALNATLLKIKTNFKDLGL